MFLREPQGLPRRYILPVSACISLARILVYSGLPGLTPTLGASWPARNHVTYGRNHWRSVFKIFDIYVLYTRNVNLIDTFVRLLGSIKA